MKRLPPRSKVKPADTWDLSSLYESDTAWEAAFTKFEKEIAKYEKFKGTLGDSAEQLAKLLKFDSGLERLGERLGNYAFLKTTEDQANSESQRMLGRFTNVSSKASQAASFIRPEILEIPAAKRRIGCCSSGLCATSRTRSARRKKISSPCRAKWRGPRGKSFGN